MLTNRRAILHVDDDEAQCRFIKHQLAPHGYEVTSITDAHEAIDAIIRGQFRVVILDIDMPEKSGMHLLSEIKNHDAGIQVIMLTGIVNVTTVLEAIQSGAEACHFKPVESFDSLVESIAHCFIKIDRWWHTLRDLAQRRKEESSQFAAFNPEPTYQVEPEAAFND